MNALLVAIHDVTPAFADEARTLWQLCADRGAAPALFVVPQWHGAHPIEQDHDFLAWLRGRVDDGAELFVHGERHDEVGLRRSFADELRALGRTAQEGEFLTLDEDEARARIERGIARLRALGLTPVGFVAPAWLASPGTSRAAARAGLKFGEDHRSIILHERNARIAAPVVRWSARTAFRARASALVADARWLAQHDTPVARIALHPADLHDRTTARSVRRTLDRWLATRRPFRYAEL